MKLIIYEPTCFDVKVAWARKQKLAKVNVIDKYELNEDLKDDPASRDTKKGVAVINTSVHDVL